MRAYAENHNIFRKQVKTAFPATLEKVVLITPLVTWYLQHGLEVAHIYQFVEHQPSRSWDFWTGCL